MPEQKKQYNGWTENRTRQHQEYVAKFSQLKARMTEDRRDHIKKHAENMGESLNGFVIRAVKEAMGKEDLDGKEE